MREFFDNNLLETEYFKTLKESENSPFFNPYRSLDLLLHDLECIFEYNEAHARSFTRRLKNEKDFRNCEAIFTEIIVYTYYLKLVNEAVLNSLALDKAECDLKIELRDGTCHFLEIFSVMPDIKNWTKEEIEKGEICASEIKTHQQDPLCSIRQKLLEKVSKRGQMSKLRRNYAVIELNDPRIADDFTILSSLSSGYKIAVDLKSRKVVNEGYDWSRSVFDEPSLRNLAGIIYFMMGDYSRRKFIFNPNYGTATGD